MLFQTPEFLVLMLAVLTGIVLLRSHTLKLAMILLASWIFYAAWEPIFLTLLFYCTINDYLLGIAIGDAGSRSARRNWLVVSLFTNLGVLAVFKYANFFAGIVNAAVRWLGQPTLLPPIELTLPVGISFYTFHSMGYNIDVFRGKTPPERSFVRFAIYVAFFPQLVAGPILRAGQFLPQLRRHVSLDGERLRRGIHLFLVGLVKKVVVADNVAPLVDHVFGSPQGLSSLAIWMGSIGFMIQIYCDFSGYTDMARGASRMLGFEIPINFDRPYFARTITDFWRRWHISLSSWLRDYLYIPLGGNRHGIAMTYRNLLLTMGLGGLWHGASWNFVIWGLYQGVLLALERAFGIGEPRESSAATRVFRWAVCQYLVLFGWLLFRVQDAADLSYCVRKFLLPDLEFGLQNVGFGNFNPFLVLGVSAGFVVAHGMSHRLGGIPEWLDSRSGSVRWLAYAATTALLMALWPSEQSAFIYFQF